MAGDLLFAKFANLMNGVDLFCRIYQNGRSNAAGAAFLRQSAASFKWVN